MSAHMRIAAIAALSAITTGAAAQTHTTDVEPSHKYSWGENIGWMNWRDADGGDDGAMITFLDDPIFQAGDPVAYFHGHVWAENAGWITLGNGFGPYNGVFGNGVNILTSGYLDGYAWGENIGWINFGTQPHIGADGARFDFMSNRLRGFAWSENEGWINLDDMQHYVQFVEVCSADLTGDDVVNGADLAAMLAAWGQNLTPADLTGDGTVNGADLAALLANWGMCP